MNIKKMQAGVWPFTCYVSIGETNETILQYFKENPPKKPLSEKDISKIDIPGSGRSVQFDNGEFLLMVKNFPVTPWGFATLQHEIFHIAHFVLEYFGMKLSNDSDEAWAYLIDYLTNMIYTDFNLLSDPVDISRRKQKNSMPKAKPAAKPMKKAAPKKK